MKQIGRKSLALLTALVMAATLCILPAAAEETDLVGNGTVEEPYQITGSGGNLQAIGTLFAGQAPDHPIYMQVAENFTLTNNLQIPVGFDVVLDFAGKTITYQSASMFSNYGTLTVNAEGNQGGINCPKGCIVNYGDLTVNGGTYVTTLNTSGTALLNNSDGAVMVIKDAEVNAAFYAVANSGGTVTIDGGTFQSTACNHNGKFAYTITNQGGELYFNDGEVEGVQGALAIANGYSEIRGGTFTTVACSTGTADNCKNGATAHYAVYIAGEFGEVETRIYGGTFTSASKVAINVGNDNAGGDGGIRADASAFIYGGTFIGGGNEALYSAVNTGNPSIQGGTFNSDVSGYVADGYVCAEKGGSYTVGAKPPEVLVEGTSTATAVYANGISILVKKDSGTAYLYDADGVEKLSDKPITGSTTIYGGGKNTDVEGDTNIVVDDVTVGYIYGGGYSDGTHSANVGGDTHVSVKGKVIAKTYGGGKAEGKNGAAQANVAGTAYSINPSMVDKPDSGFTQAGHTIYGGGSAMSINNSAQADVGAVVLKSGGPIYAIRGGGTATGKDGKTATADCGAISIQVEGGDVREIYSAGHAVNADAVANAASVKLVTTDTEAMIVYGGGTADGGKADVAGKIDIDMTRPYLYGYVYGGGDAGKGGSANVGDVNLKLNDSKIPAEEQWGDVVSAAIYGGGEASAAGSSAVAGRVHMTVTGGTIAGNFRAGGNASSGGNAAAGDSTITIGGTAGSVLDEVTYYPCFYPQEKDNAVVPLQPKTASLILNGDLTVSELCYFDIVDLAGHKLEVQDLYTPDTKVSDSSQGKTGVLDSKAVAQVGYLAYGTMADAVEAVAEGGTIQMLPGTHNEPVVLPPKTLTLVGAPDHTSTLTGGISTGTADYKGVSFTIDGLAFRSEGIEIVGWTQSTGLDQMTGLTIKSCSFQDIDSGLYGVHINNGDNAISNLTLQDNTFTDIGYASGAENGGVYATCCGELTITGNTFTRMGFNGLTLFGKDSHGSAASKITITGNTFDQWGKHLENGIPTGRAMRLSSFTVPADMTQNKFICTDIPEEYIKLTDSEDHAPDLKLCYWNGENPSSQGFKLIVPEGTALMPYYVGAGMSGTDRSDYTPSSGSSGSTSPSKPTVDTETKTEGDVKTETVTETVKNKDGSTTTNVTEKAENTATGETTETKATETVAKDGSVTKEEVKTTTAADGTKTEEKNVAISDKATGTETTAQVVTDGTGRTVATAKTEAKPEAAVKDGAATAAVDQKAAEKLVEQAKTAAEAAKDADRVEAAVVLTAQVPEHETVTAVSVEVPKTAVESLAKETAAAVVVSTPIADVTLPNSALESLAGQKGETVAVKAEKTEDGGVKVSVTVGDQAVETVRGGLKASLPAEEAAPGTVAVLVHADGTEEIIRKSVVTGDTAVVPLDGSATIKLVDNGKNFPDTADHWAGEAVEFVTARGLFQGVSDDSFAPGAEMTRGMLVTVLNRLENEPETEGTLAFPDVTGDAYYAGAVAWAAEMGIVTGTGAGFDPEAPITRQTLATILYRYLGTQGADLSVRGDLSAYADGDAVDGWAQEAIAYAVGAGLMTGKDGQALDPAGTATRAEVAIVLQRMVEGMA